MMMLKRIGQCALILLVSVAVGFLMLLGVNALPGEPVVQNILEASSVFEHEGDYWMSFEGRKSAQLDNFTDALTLAICGYPGEENVLERTLHCYFLRDEGPASEWLRFLEDSEREEGTRIEYARYWHGYQVVLRPLLMVFNYRQIRILNSLLVLGEIVGISLLLFYRGKGEILPAFLLMVCYLNPSTISNSLQNSRMFHLMALFSIAVLCLRSIRRNVVPFFLLAGICTSFFDFLTYPVITFGVPATLMVLVDEDSGLKDLTAAVIAWAAGYALMWSAKWGLCTILTRGMSVENVLDPILFRTSSQLPEGIQITPELFLTELESYYGDGLCQKLMLLSFLVQGFMGALAGKWNRQTLTRVVCLAGVSLLPFAWYMGMPNHSMIHLQYTYRATGVTILAASMVLFPVIDWERVKTLLLKKLRGSDKASEKAP